jgi:hypothetical protein
LEFHAFTFKVGFGGEPAMLFDETNWGWQHEASPPNLLAKTLTNKESRSQGIPALTMRFTLNTASVQSALNR